jgi:hypothetical protein
MNLRKPRTGSGGYLSVADFEANRTCAVDYGTLERALHM